ncbi:MAG: hypothetical protein ABW219_13855 [Ilumatobacteraceae bacterium]
MVAADALAGIERWFVERGLPHFVERHDTAAEIWGRALPLLIAAYLLLGLNALDIWEWSLAKNLVVAAFVVVGALVTWVVANRMRGRGWFERPHHIGPAELAVFTIVPAVPSLLVGQWADAAKTVAMAIGILALLWAITSYGVPSLLRWAWQRSTSQLPLLLNVVVRALPLMLLFTTFLFINAEVWQVAGTLTGVVYVATLGIFFALGAFFILSRVPALMSELNHFESWDQVESLAVDTPAAAVFDAVPAASDETPADVAGRPTMRQRVNIGLVTIFSQAIQITFVGLALTGFFVLFGFLAIPEPTTAAWTTLDPVHVIGTWSVGGRTLVITEPLIRVSAFLGAFTAMYFTVQLSTDATYREEFADDVGPQLRQALAVRCVYRAARADPTTAATR